MAKITKTKFEVVVESAGDYKEFDRLFKAYRRAKNVQVKKIESKTTTVRKDRKVTQQMQDTQTIKKILRDQFEEMGYTYHNPNVWYDGIRQSNKALFTLRADNKDVSIWCGYKRRGHHSGRTGSFYIKIDPKSAVLDFCTSYWEKRNGKGDKVSLADPDSVQQIQNAIKKKLGHIL